MSFALMLEDPLTRFCKTALLPTGVEGAEASREGFFTVLANCAPVVRIAW